MIRTSNIHRIHVFLLTVYMCYVINIMNVLIVSRVLRCFNYATVSQLPLFVRGLFKIGVSIALKTGQWGL
jgi:hypothetical protein